MFIYNRGDVHRAVEVHPKETTNPEVEHVCLIVVEGVHLKMAPQGTNTEIILQDYVLSRNRFKKEVRTSQRFACAYSIAYTFQTTKEFVSPIPKMSQPKILLS